MTATASPAEPLHPLSGAHNLLVRRGSGQMTTPVPRGRIPLATDLRL